MSNDDFRLSSAVGAMVHRMENGLGTGDLAALRRAGSGAYAPAFWRLLFEFVPDERRGSAVMERRWANAVALLATCTGLYSRDVRAGSALQESGWSETRLVRLLEARDEQLEAAMRQVGHYLASKQQRANLADLVDLLIYQEGDHADRVRLNLARNYYRSENKQTSTKKDEQ